MRTVANGIEVLPLRTPTLPPATHTNTYVVGNGALTVFDPASPYPDEQASLVAALEDRVADGEVLERIVLTHHHHDHVRGAVALRDHFGVPIVAHPITRDLLAGDVPVDELWEDGQAHLFGGVRLVGVHTPGHARGHLVFHDPDSGAVIAGDMVAGIGTILIDPRDGDLGTYLASLERMRGLKPSVLLPAHGDPLAQADAVLAFYIAHRHQRTEQIRQALDSLGSATPDELVPHVYQDVPKSAWPIAAVQITAHLLWMHEHGLARADDPLAPTTSQWST